MGRDASQNKSVFLYQPDLTENFALQWQFKHMMFHCKGRHQNNKNFSIRALPELPKPPHPPMRATLPTLSGRQKRRCAYGGKKY